MSTVALGIDIGGSGVKGAPVDVARGVFTADRLRIPTPHPSTPEAIATTVADIASHFDLDSATPIGVTIPGVVRHNVVYSAANIDDAWVGRNVEDVFREACGGPVHAVNDADAAGFAEARFGAAKNMPGVVLVSTLGTGIGSALICDGVLVPNTELGHLEIDGQDAESFAADSARTREGLSWEEWALRLQRYYSHVEFLFSPDLIVIGGGVSKKSDRFLPLLSLNATVVPAALRNAAGIVGAAVLAAEEPER